MMDDIRPPRRALERRDYTLPARRHPLPSAQPPPSVSHRHVPAAPAPPPHYQRPAPLAPNPERHRQEPAHRHPQTHAMAGSKRRLGRRYLATAAVLVLAAGLFGAGYIFRSKTPANSLPAAVVAKATFNVYFPSPMPSGYTYIAKTATFQIGSVFYRFADGQKSVTVREEPLPAKKPDLSLLKGYVPFRSSAGPAAIGLSFGQPVAVVVAPTTVITLNTSGGVAPKDLKTAIDNLHNIGSSSQGVSHG